MREAGAVRRASAAQRSTRAERLRAPLLLAFAAFLTIEAAGGLVIFCARLAFGTTPGAALHVALGIALTGLYAAYQWGHWFRVAPWRSRLDYLLGLLASASLALTQATGFVLAVAWWNGVRRGAPPEYAPQWSALHNIGSMLVLTFTLSHLGAVLRRAPGRAGA